MSLLEVQNIGDGTPQGVVLALVGPTSESSRDHEGMRTLRMYNLASLISLAKWSIAQKASANAMTAECLFIRISIGHQTCPPATTDECSGNADKKAQDTREYHEGLQKPSDGVSGDYDTHHTTILCTTAAT